jgi:hypothetical protein
VVYNEQKILIIEKSKPMGMECNPRREVDHFQLLKIGFVCCKVLECVNGAWLRAGRTGGLKKTRGFVLRH